MAIPINGHCGKQLRAKDESAGKRVKCPAWETVLTIPPKPSGARDGEQNVHKPHRFPVLSVGVGVFCAAVIVGAVVLDRMKKADRANEIAASKV
ncbi:hypothetical protein EP7_002232 [Isosphaeraceae bacterium EP7]